MYLLAAAVSGCRSAATSPPAAGLSCRCRPFADLLAAAVCVASAASGQCSTKTAQQSICLACDYHLWYLELATTCSPVLLHDDCRLPRPTTQILLPTRPIINRWHQLVQAANSSCTPCCSVQSPQPAPALAVLLQSLLQGVLAIPMPLSAQTPPWTARVPAAETPMPLTEDKCRLLT